MLVGLVQVLYFILAEPSTLQDIQFSPQHVETARLFARAATWRRRGLVRLSSAPAVRARYVPRLRDRISSLHRFSLRFRWWRKIPIRADPFPALCRICEPIAFMSIFPYVYHMVESFHVTDNDRKIALYAGMITSAFTFAEFSAGMFWGRMSDRVGRKPVLVMGLVGTAVSMVVFGFAPNLPTAMLARALGGLLNGNIGVLQTTVAELVTVKEHQPRAYSIMPFVWCLGSIIGPALGGALAQPCENYPWLFSRGTLFDRFPFLLPNLVCLVVLGCGIVVGTLFLEETHAEKKHRRDPGLELGRWLVSKCSGLPVYLDADPKEGYNGAEYVGYDDVSPPEYKETESSPCLSSTKESQDLSEDEVEGQEKKPPGVPKAFTRQVVFNIIAYGILA